MGKASRWFRSVLGLKKPSDQPLPQQQHAATAAARPKEKRRWSFVKSYREKDNHGSASAAASARVLQGARDGHSSAAVMPRRNAVAEDYDADEDERCREEEEDPNERAMAVAAATAKVAEAAVAAANAAAVVVRLTSSGRSAGECSVVPGSGGGCSSAYVSGSLGLREDFAALKIQAAFRGYLARRALKALRALVRLQALVRGHIERKRTAAWLQQMQAVLLAQARARVGRLQVSESSQSSGGKSSHSHSHSHHQHHHQGPATPEKFEHGNRTKSGKYEPSSLLKRTGSRSNDNKPHSSLRRSETRSDRRSWDPRAVAMEEDVKNNSDKILEIDNAGGRYQYHHHHGQDKRRNMFHSANLSFFYDQYSQSFTTSKDTCPSPTSGEVQSTMYPPEVDQEVFCTAENSPQVFSAASSRGARRSPFTPTRSDGSRSSFLSAFADHPNYMSYTESARAKARSLSAPKQRPPQYERSGSGKRFGEPRSSSAQRASAVKASFSSKGYPGSGRLDQMGMPMWQRC
ncbi:unnamed protein product [Linum trigynum]|uniref:DUF4005 domain-containing protein n=1 Tax=Linum trigynum TaxID=586398 RepID=A0AAV2DNW6_9ROSI